MVFEGLTVGQILGFLKDAGASGILLLAIAGLLRGWIVPKWAYDSMVAERDQWRSVATEGLASVKQLVEIAEMVNPIRRRSGDDQPHRRQ